MKSFAECAIEDSRIVNHCWRNYRVTPEHAKNKREQELVADKFRIEGRIMGIHKNKGTCRETQAKRGI